MCPLYDFPISIGVHTAVLVARWMFGPLQWGIVFKSQFSKLKAKGLKIFYARLKWVQSWFKLSISAKEDVLGGLWVVFWPFQGTFGHRWGKWRAEWWRCEATVPKDWRYRPPPERQSLPAWEVLYTWLAWRGGRAGTTVAHLGPVLCCLVGPFGPSPSESLSC